MNPLLQVGDPLKKVPGLDLAGQKSTDPTGSGSSSLVKYLDLELQNKDRLL